MRRYLYMLLALALLLAGCASSPGSATTTTPVPTSTSATSALTPTAGSTTPGTSSDLPTSSLPGITLPPGFQISIYARGLNIPRFMLAGPNNTLLVADRGGNNILALTPGSSPTQVGQMRTLLSGLNGPTSLDFHDGYLYIGEGNAIARVKLDNNLHTGPIERIIPNLPEGGQHSTRTVLIGPDNHIYVSIGSDCNVCVESSSYRAAIWVYNMDGSGGRQYAKGLRNAVGLQVNPWNQQIWATNNGRDQLGDDVPPETLYNIIDQGNYGWPSCHAGTIIDPQFGKSGSCDGIQQPLEKMQAHSAPLGLAFYHPQKLQFPAQYQNSAYIAFHGSWNRTTPTGHKIVRIPLKNGQVAGPAEDFASGWLTANNTVTGRPTGVTVAADGSLFVSDDTYNVIYHIWYRG